jgi:5-formyltetrahydrofolate cyclo-ligase
MKTVIEYIKQQKQQLRLDIREHLKAITHDQRVEWSSFITNRLLELPEYQSAKVIMVFLSLLKEFDTSSLISQALKKKKIICAPKVDWMRWNFTPVRMLREDDFDTDDHHLREPVGSETIAAEDIDVVLVPGLAYDLQGNRLGRGGGFYDWFFSRVDLTAKRIAPTFDFQIKPVIPHNSHDQKVDVILSPTKLIKIVR